MSNCVCHCLSQALGRSVKKTQCHSRFTQITNYSLVLKHKHPVLGNVCLQDYWDKWDEQCQWQSGNLRSQNWGLNFLKFQSCGLLMGVIPILLWELSSTAAGQVWPSLLGTSTGDPTHEVITFKVIIDKYDPVAIYFIVLGSSLYTFFVFPI